MKVDDYNLSKLSNEAENFKEDLSNIINYGKYSAQVVTAGSGPTWTARNGEFVFFTSGGLKRLFFYNNNAWDYLEYNSGVTATAIRTWITFSGTGLLEITDSYNVTSLTRTAAGHFEATIDIDYLNTGYARGSGNCRMGGNTRYVLYKSNSLGSLDIDIRDGSNSNADPDSASIMSTGDQ